MTTLDALAAACEATPDDEAVRLYWLDCFEEEHGTTPFVEATREFLGRCGERRKYVDAPRVNGVAFIPRQRRALPGWRDWLVQPEGAWFLLTGLAAFGPGAASNVNWFRLVPSLWSMLAGADRWRRKGSWVTVESWNNNPPPHPSRARLEFARGFIRRVEFRDWQSADAMLPALLADQPFVEAGIRNAVVWNGDLTHGASIPHDRVGPLFELLQCDFRVGRDHAGRPIVPWPNGTETDAVFEAGLCNPGARARRALSRALKRRARTAATT